MSELNRATEFMSIFNGTLRRLLILIIVGSMFLGGCSYIPWVENDEDDLAFEEDFPFEDEQDLKEGEDDFFEEGGGKSSDEILYLMRRVMILLASTNVQIKRS